MTLLVEQLDMPSPRGLEDLGGRWDMEVLDGCRQYARLDDAPKLDVRRSMTNERSWAIVGWAEGTASLAVRWKDRELLVLGLVGLSLFGSDFDDRDAQLVYPLFARAAELVGADIVDVTGTAAEMADSVGRRWLLDRLKALPSRLPGTHRESGSGDKFSFERVGARWDPAAELADFLDEEDNAH